MALSVVDLCKKLLFDETITKHPDIESVIFPSERIRRRLCGALP